MTRSGIVVLGSANMDLVVRQQRLPGAGETIFGHDLTTVPGGKGLNQAVAAARAGAAVRFVGAVGEDEYGTRLLSVMHADGIETTGVDRVDTATGTAHISVLDSGDNAIVVVPGANGVVMSLSDEQRAVIAGAELLVMQWELPLEVIAEARAHAAAAGVRTVLTPAPVVDVPLESLAGIDLLVPNEHEAVQLAGVDGTEAAAIALSRATGGTVIVTLGSQGCLRAEGGEIVARHPARVVEAVDTTAAGDTFVGVLCALWLETGDLDEATRWATNASSIAVTRAGATTSMPTRAELDALA